MSDIRQSVRDYVRATQELLNLRDDLSNEELEAVDAMQQQVVAMLRENWTG